jgi:anthranilate phosphoribosyltransferase
MKRYAANVATGIPEGMVLAREAIASGAASAKLDALVNLSQALATA